jgi:hypothetical protein
MKTSLPNCVKCKTPLPRESFNSGGWAPCPECSASALVEVFPAFGRKPGRGTVGDLSVGGEEACCFYHESRKASEVCDLCGRFLCGLCDCPISGKHYCPGCLEAGRSNRRIRELDNSRTLYGRQAFWLAILPFYVTGIIAVFMALRYRNAPESLVKPQRWMFTAALVLGSIQTLAFTALSLRAFIT